MRHAVGTTWCLFNHGGSGWGDKRGCGRGLEEKGCGVGGGGGMGNGGGVGGDCWGGCKMTARSHHVGYTGGVREGPGWRQMWVVESCDGG